MFSFFKRKPDTTELLLLEIIKKLQSIEKSNEKLAGCVTKPRYPALRTHGNGYDA
jgi:hypothetical protein